MFPIFPAVSSTDPDLSLPTFPIASSLGPVGARLQLFWRNWQSIGADPWVVHILRHGYRLPFGSDLPPLTCSPVDMSYKSSHPLFQELQDQVSKLLSKGAIEEVTSPSRGFYSRLFLAPKKTGDWRPVIDLSYLNNFIISPHFKMETVASILGALQPGHWCTSLDLKDAFFHVPIAPSHRRYLRFKLGQKHYQFRALPFGLTTSPLVFTRVVKAVGSYAHSLGIRLILYLDDWCLSASSPEAARRQTSWLLDIATSLGLVVNLEKSDLSPSQLFQFVGISFDLSSGRAYPAPHRLESLHRVASQFLASQAPSALLWQCLLGHLTSLEKLVPRGRLFMRPLQFDLKDQWDQRAQPQSCQIAPSADSLAALRWWLDSVHLTKGLNLLPQPPPILLFTDASKEGWGAHLLDSQAEGLWSAEQKLWHINNLELLALHLALKEFLPQVRGRRVLAMTDNTTVVGQVSNQGGTLSRALYTLTKDLFLWCDLHEIALSARHIPGHLNVTADRLSRRHQIIQTEWSLSPSVAKRLWKVWGQPHVDLFATSENAKLPTYVSPLPDPAAWKQDALSFPWDGLWAYAFPPFPLIQRVLQKASLEPCELLLIAPLWPAQTWYPRLLELLVDLPRLLPQTKTLLRQTGSHQFHNNLKLLNLHAWRLSSLPSAPRVSRQLLQAVSPQPTAPAHAPSMTADGSCFVTGAPSNNWIRSLPLLP